MKDLFEKEEEILTDAKQFLEKNSSDLPKEYSNEFEKMVFAYAFLLRQLRWMTKISDMTTYGLNSDRISLLIKVNIDALTEIYNRRFLIANLNHHIELLSQAGSPLTVMMVDIDFFKSYNDFYGHPTGDLCLRQIATTIRNSLTGADDFVARYGGEEFAIVIPGEGKDTAVRIAKRVIDNINKLDIPHIKSPIDGRVTVSIGVVSTIPNEKTKLQDFIAKSDEALYQSKQNGRNQFTYIEMEE